MRNFAVSFVVVFTGLFLGGEANAQSGGNAASAMYQQYMTNGAQALTNKNYVLAYQDFHSAVRLFPRDTQANLMLKQTVQAQQQAVVAYNGAIKIGQTALASKNFAGAFTAFQTAAATLPFDNSRAALANRYSQGTNALLATFTALAGSPPNYTVAGTNYASAAKLLSGDHSAQGPLREASLALAEGKNPAHYFASFFRSGRSELQSGRYSQAVANFKAAVSLPVDVTDQGKAQRYYDGAVAMQMAAADLSGKTPNFADMTANYQIGVKLATDFKDNSVAAALTHLKRAVETGLNAEITRGYQYLRTNDLVNGFNSYNNVNAVVQAFPDLPKAQMANAQKFVAYFQANRQVTLADALNKGYIDPATFAVSGNNPTSVNFAFQSTLNFAMFLKIPVGSIWQAKLTGQQMVLLQDTSVQIQPKSMNQLQIIAASTDPSQVAPLTGDPLVLGPGVPKLTTFVTILQAGSTSVRVRQFAVWIFLSPGVMNVAVGSTPPTPDEITTLRAVFTSAGLNPQAYSLLKN